MRERIYIEMGGARGIYRLDTGRYRSHCKDGLCTLPITFSATRVLIRGLSPQRIRWIRCFRSIRVYNFCSCFSPCKPVLECRHCSYTSSTVNFCLEPVVNAESYTCNWKSQWGDEKNKCSFCKMMQPVGGDCIFRIRCRRWEVINGMWLRSIRWYDTIEYNEFHIYNKVSTLTGLSPSGTIYSENPLSFTFSRVGR
jgi:hypothetical protein